MIFLDFEPSTFTFHESDGTVTNIINIAKVHNPPQTEVNLPLRVLTLSGTADVGIGENQCQIYLHFFPYLLLV